MAFPVPPGGVAHDETVLDPDGPLRMVGDGLLVGDEDHGMAGLVELSKASRMMSPVLVSRLPVGSSARIRAGSLISALAIATRWI